MSLTNPLICESEQAQVVHTPASAETSDMVWESSTHICMLFSLSHEFSSLTQFHWTPHCCTALLSLSLSLLQGSTWNPSLWFLSFWTHFQESLPAELKQTFTNCLSFSTRLRIMIKWCTSEQNVIQREVSTDCMMIYKWEQRQYFKNYRSRINESIINHYDSQTRCTFMWETWIYITARFLTRIYRLFKE